MDLYAIIGNPVEHSQSPFIHERFAEQTGQALRYVRLLAPLHGFAATLSAFVRDGGHGCNVTVPFKFEACQLAARRSARAALAGSANTLRRDAAGWWADNTDGIGLLRDITVNAGVSVAGQRVLIVGAGGAAAGSLGPLIEARPREIVVANRSAAKADALVDTHRALATERQVVVRGATLEGCGIAYDVVINATASSLLGAPPPVPNGVLRRGALALDLMYGAAARGFLDWASAHGATPRDGLGMLVEQAAEAFLAWRGVRPDVQAVLRALRARLRESAA